MKKLKNLIAFVMVVILIFCFTVSSSATSVLDGSTSNDYKIDAELESVMNEAKDNENIEVVLWLSDVDNEERSNLISEGIRTAETKGALKSDFANITDLSVLKSTMLSTLSVPPLSTVTPPAASAAPLQTVCPSLWPTVSMTRFWTLQATPSTKPTL